MKKQLPAWAALCIIALIAGLLLGVTNAMTADRIQEQTQAASETSRRGVLPAAKVFEQQELAADAKVDNCYVGKDGETIVGYTAQVTTKGYGGEIEVIVGLDTNGSLTGISVGGANFAETAGLGARTKEAAFTDQFRGVTPPAAIGDNVQGVTSATISSGAVVSAVNRAADFMKAQYLGGSGGAEGGASEGPLPGATNLTEQPAADGIVSWSKADEGIVVTVSEKGFGGDIEVTVGIYNDGTIAGIVIDAPNETAGLGERVMSDASFGESFIGKSAPVSVDTLAGATISSTAVITAVNRAMEMVGK